MAQPLNMAVDLHERSVQIKLRYAECALTSQRAASGPVCTTILLHHYRQIYVSAAEAIKRAKVSPRAVSHSFAHEGLYVLIHTYIQENERQTDRQTRNGHRRQIGDTREHMVGIYICINYKIDISSTEYTTFHIHKMNERFLLSYSILRASLNVLLTASSSALSSSSPTTTSSQLSIAPASSSSTTTTTITIILAVLLQVLQAAVNKKPP